VFIGVSFGEVVTPFDVAVDGRQVFLCLFFGGLTVYSLDCPLGVYEEFVQGALFSVEELLTELSGRFCCAYRKGHLLGFHGYVQ